MLIMIQVTISDINGVFNKNSFNLEIFSVIIY